MIGWTKQPGPDAAPKFATWTHQSGWTVEHCGHPTANWPYHLGQPGRTETIVSDNGRGFRTAEIARFVVLRILSGEFHVTTEHCVRGVARVANVSADGTLMEVYDTPQLRTL